MASLKVCFALSNVFREFALRESLAKSACGHGLISLRFRAAPLRDAVLRSLTGRVQDAPGRERSQVFRCHRVDQLHGVRRNGTLTRQLVLWQWATQR